MDRFNEIETFIRVVDTGSITRAAQRLGVAKSAVSRRIAELERRLGAQLVTRTTRRLTVTETGQAFYERARHVLADLIEAESSVADTDGDLSGTLRIAAPVTFGLIHLTPILTEFMQQHPAVTVDVDFSDRHVDLIEDRFDIAVRIGRLNDSSLIARRLGPIHQIVCASPTYLAYHGTPATPDDLAAHHCLHYSLDPQGRHWHYTAPDGTSGEITVGAHAIASNGEFLRDAAIAGQGITRLPTFMIYRAVTAGKLIPILTDYQWVEIGLHALYPPTRRLARRVRAFVDLLAARFPQEPCWDQCMSTARNPGSDAAEKAGNAH